jgi:hypothetical protein
LTKKRDADTLLSPLSFHNFLHGEEVREKNPIDLKGGDGKEFEKVHPAFLHVGYSYHKIILNSKHN